MDDDLRIAIYVALRTVRQSVKSRYAKPRTAQDGDAATDAITDAVMKVIEREKHRSR